LAAGDNRVGGGDRVVEQEAKEFPERRWLDGNGRELKARRHQSAVAGVVEDFAAIGVPSGVRAALDEDLPFAAGIGESGWASSRAARICLAYSMAWVGPTS